MSRRSNRFRHGLGDMIQKKRDKYLQAHAPPQCSCSIATCSDRATHWNLEGVRLCDAHYHNYLRSNPPAGEPIRITNMPELYPEWEQELDGEDYPDDPYDEYEEEYDAEQYENESWKDSYPHGDGWEMGNSDTCPTCGKMVDFVFLIDATEPFAASLPEAGIEVWGPADSEKVIVCKGYSSDYTSPHVHIRFSDGEERLVFLEGFKQP